MKTKYCPDRKENCNPDDCAHWRNVRYLQIPSGYGRYDSKEVIDGICRLWVDKENDTI